MFRKIIILSIGLLLGTFALAQKKKQIEYSTLFGSYYYRGPVSVAVGGINCGYSGDLDRLPGPKLSPGLSLTVSYKVWTRIYFGGEVSYLAFKQTAGFGKTGSISFTSKAYEVMAFGRFNLVDRKIFYKHDLKQKPQRIRPYLVLGLGMAYVVPTLDYTYTYFKYNYEKKTSAQVTPVIPAALGIELYLNKYFSVLGELAARFTFTDHLDGVNKLKTKGNDRYINVNLKLQYTFHPIRKRRAKYEGPPLVFGSANGEGSKSKDTTGKKTEQKPTLSEETPEQKQD